MKGSTRRCIALDFLLLKPGKYIGNLIILTLTLFAIGMTLLLYVRKHYVRLGFEEAVSVPPSQVACCTVHSLENETQEKIKDEIGKIEEISLIGPLYEENSVTAEFLEAYESVQKKNMRTVQKDNSDSVLEAGFVSMVVMGREFWDVFRLSLIEGEEPVQQREKNIIELYVGYELRNVYPVGSEFEIRGSNGDVRCVYRIAGILRSGSMVMAPDIGNTVTEIGAVNMDNFVLEIQYRENVLQRTGEFFFFAESSEDMKTAQKKVSELAEKYEAEIYVSIIEKVMESGERENRSDLAQQQYAVFLLAVTAVILLLVSQVMEQMDFSEAYGIWYANGATKKDMRRILFFQNLLRLIPACILAAAGSYYTTLYIYESFQERIVMRQIFLRWMLPGILLSGVLIVAAAVLVPLFILNRRNAVELLNRRVSEGRTRRSFLKFVRDGRMSGLQILEILLVLLLFTNAAMYFHSYQYAGETVTLNGSYKNQQTLGIDVDWQANIGEDGWTPQIQESTVDELLEFCGSVKDLPISVTLYFDWMISMPYEYAMAGLLLTDSEPPQKLNKGKYEPNRQGIYLSEALVPLLETDESGAYLESFHTRFPLLGTVAAKGQETEDSMYVYFHALEETTQRKVLEDMINMRIDAAYFEPFALVVGSNDAEIGGTVEAVQAALTGKTMISCKELETEEAIAAISGNQDIMQDQAVFRLLVIGIVMFFCMVSLLQVLSLWMERKREEITIRWAVGMKKRQILGALMQEMLCLMAVCLLFGGVVELAVCWGVKRYSFLFAAGYLAAASVGTFLVFSALLVHVFRKSTRSMELAVLLRE